MEKRGVGDLNEGVVLSKIFVRAVDPKDLELNENAVADGNASEDTMYRVTTEKP